jgi:hypothetical protein
MVALLPLVVSQTGLLEGGAFAAALLPAVGFGQLGRSFAHVTVQFYQQGPSNRYMAIPKQSHRQFRAL